MQKFLEFFFFKKYFAKGKKWNLWNNCYVKIFFKKILFFQYKGVKYEFTYSRSNFKIFIIV